jgi:hypothetical protein
VLKTYLFRCYFLLQLIQLVGGALSIARCSTDKQCCRHTHTCQVKVTLRLTISQSVSRAPSVAHDQIFITVWQLRSCSCGAPSLTRGRVLLALASAIFLGSESLGSRNHMLLSHMWEYHFRRLLRLAGSRWRYSISPPHGEKLHSDLSCLLYKYRYPRKCLLIIRIHGNVFRTELVSKNQCLWKRVWQLVS